LILLAFLLPLAFYLLILGSINRRRRPLLVSGVWDFVGLLFAASGFLLFGGPAVLSSLSERWRRRWLLGQAGGEVGEGLYEFWVFLSALYFVAVVAGAAWLLWRQRHLTAVYNVPRDLLEEALGRACDRLGLNPVRSGNLFLFGPSFAATVGRRRPGPEAVQAPHHRPVAVQPLTEEHLAPAKGGSPAEHLLGQTAVLEVDPFPALRHATLRWDPADAPLRQEVEAELSRVLDKTPVPDHALGLWLTVLGLALLLVVLAGGLLLFVLSLLPLR
jgi:hypothetical protein